MKRHALWFGSAAAALSLSAGVAAAGELAGKVVDGTTGRPLPNATVRIPTLNRTVTSDRSGAYRINDVPAGSYSLEVEYVGFEKTAANVTVTESGAAEQNFALTGFGTQEITVTGYRLAQATALQDKKSANKIKESITADDAGKLPDKNAAETLARVPGVAVTTDQGEGRYVTIRGIDPSLSNVTIDNQIIGSPEGDTRRVALDTVPADLLAKLEVIKSVTPDMDGNSIGGTINILTPSAFDDPDGRFLSGTAEVGYYDLNGKSPYSGGLAFGQTFGAEKQWGIVLSASYSDRKYSSENLQGGDPWVDPLDEDEPSGLLVPDEFVLRDYEIRRVRKGFVANLEFRPNDDVKLYFRNLYNRYEDTELQPEFVLDYRNGDLEDVTATSGTFTEGEAQRVNSRRFEIQSIQTSSLGGEFTVGDWIFDLSGTYGKTEQDTPYDIEYTFELDDEIPMSYDTSRRFFRVTPGPEAYDADLFEFEEANVGGQLIEEELTVLQFDVQRAFTVGDTSGSFKVGAKLIDRDQESDQDMNTYDGFDGDYLLSQVSQPGRSGFYSSEGGYNFGPRVNFDAANNFFRANRADFELNDADTIANSYGVDYTVKEKVTAAYAMATVDVGRATFVGGVRVEKTESDFTAYDIQFVDGDAEDPPPQVTGSKDYTNWMPGIQMTLAARDDILVRAAWTNTIGRPSYEQNVPFRLFEIEDDGDGAFEGAIEAGNPDLDPLESANYDLAVEWYLDAGIVSAGVFYKDIENPIFTRIQQLEDETFEGREYSELEIVRPENAESGEILGVELNFQQQFRGLPSPFDGLGMQVSYTYSDSEADVFDRADAVTFFLQSEHVGNLALFWEKYGFEVRLAYAYRSEYLDSLGDDAASDLFVDTHGQLDFKASYDVSKHVNVYVQMQNITDEPLRFYSGDKSRMAENESYGWNATAGVSVKF